MKFKSISILFIIFDLASNNFTFAEDIGPTTAKVAGYQLEIEQVGDKSYLKYHSSTKEGKFAIDIPSPCYFSIDSNGNPGVVGWNYQIQVLLIEHSIPHPMDLGR